MSALGRKRPFRSTKFDENDRPLTAKSRNWDQDKFVTIMGTISIRISEASIESIVLVEDLVHDFPTFLEFIQSEVICVEML